MSPAVSCATRRDDRAGLTLLEVLAATMIFALVITTLIGTSSALVHRSGLAARRLEAALVADAVVADLEIQMRKGIAPVVEKSEWTTEDETYVVRVLNRTLAEALAAPTTTAEEEAAIEAGNAPAPDAAGALGATSIGGANGIGPLLATQLPEVAKHLRQYDIEVVFVGSAGPESVTRTTFAFDWQAAKIEFAALFPTGEGEGDTPPLEEPNPLDPRNPPQLPGQP